VVNGPQSAPVASSSPSADGEGLPSAAGRLQRYWQEALPAAQRTGDLSPGVSASLTAVLAALRWGTVMIGLAFATGWTSQGDVRVVITLAVAIFITSWRTIAPIRFGEPGLAPLFKALADVFALSFALGFSGGLSSPFVGSLFVAMAVAGFGWGFTVAVLCASVALVFPLVVSAGLGEGLQVPGAMAFTSLLGVAVAPKVALDRLLDMEDRRQALAAQRDRLAETNQLLELLTDLARTLPSSLDLNDVIQATREQVTDTFGAQRMAIVFYEDGMWTPQFQDGFDLPPQTPTTGLAPPLDLAAVSTDVLRVEDLAPYGRHGSGLYTRLVVAGIDIGLLALEHDETGRYDPSQAEILRGMSDVLALTLANARSFRRLRSLAAAEERSRIARDLHDRLGQYLTYIALELERIMAERDQPSRDLKELYEDVQGAVGEFRDTLLELRTAVSAERPLTVVLGEVVERFEKRSQVKVDLVLPTTSDRLPAIVENELLRIAQEALVNVEKHSSASEVRLAWTISAGRGVLLIQDDGRGFDPAKGIRGSAYGLVGMRERAASVGAMLEISSQPGEGTTITVQTSQKPEQVKKA
jgi:signal transduction histidine kinase